MKMKLGAAVLMLLTLGALGEVVVNFKKCAGFFHKRKPPVFTTKRPRDSSDSSDTRYVKICQSYNKKYRYATLYDTTNKIPVYSAYKYEKTGECSVERPDITWMIEAQIENEQERGEMMLKSNLQSYPKSNLQAYNSDYVGSRYDKGHLYPHCHAPDEETSNSTFTLTNAAPQMCDFNSFWHNKVEAKVQSNLTTCLNANKTAYVVTGVVPSNESNPLALKNSQVNVPTHFWTAYCCCYNNNENCEFGGFILKREADEPDVLTFTNFNKNLRGLYGRGFKVFYSCKGAEVGETWGT